MWTPVFRTQTNDEVILLDADYLANTKDDAWKIAMGAVLFLPVLGLTYTRCLDLGERNERGAFNLICRPAMLENSLHRIPVAVVSGPTFDEAFRVQNSDPV